MAAKTGLPKPLTKGKYTEAVLQGKVPDYPDPGVGFFGYARAPVPGGWRLLKQTQRQYSFFTDGITPTQTTIRTNAATHVFYITSLVVSREHNLGAGFYLKDIAGSPINLFQGDYREAVDGYKRVEEHHFSPPLLCKGTSVSIAAYGLGDTEEIDVQLFGYDEERT